MSRISLGPQATPGDDTITGTNADDKIIGKGGDDTIRGGGGSDFILGGNGNDRIVGGAGDDILNGVGGNKGVGEKDVITGGAGADRILLGDTKTAYYVGNGNSDLAIVTGFDVSEDSLQLHGCSSDYTFELNGSGSSVNISYQGDLIARVAGATDVDALLGVSDFVGGGGMYPYLSQMTIDM